MVDWYRLVFDAKVVSRNRHIAFLTYDAEHHRIAIVTVPRLLSGVRWLARFHRKAFGVDHVAFTFSNLEKLLRNHRRLKACGVEPVWCVNHGAATSIYYEDPDGNRLEFQVDNFESPDALRVWAATGAFRDNPIGVNFDPDYLLERLEAGAPMNELLQQGAGVRPGQRPVVGMKAITWRTL